VLKWVEFGDRYALKNLLWRPKVASFRCRCRRVVTELVFRKIILRAGIVPWKKLIQNLRASFETDLLNGKYGKFGLHTIAKWLGHSVKVMLGTVDTNFS